MNREQFQMYSTAYPLDRITSYDLGNPEDGTLTLGYDIDRNTVHIYILGGHICKLVYRIREGAPQILSSHWNTTDELVPNKRAYPHYTSLRFANEMKKRGHELCFTNFDEERYDTIKHEKFHGVVMNIFGDIY